MNEIVRYEDMTQIAKAFKESGMFPDIKSEAQAIVKIQAGQELGVKPFASMQGIDMIQGKPRMSSALQAALIKRSGKYTFKTLTHTEQICKLEFFEIAMGTQLISLGYSEYTLNEAQQAGLTGKDNWRKHPKNMLFARALSNGAKWYCADVFVMAVYNESESEEFIATVPVDNTGIEALKVNPVEVKGEIVEVQTDEKEVQKEIVAEGSREEPHLNKGGEEEAQTIAPKAAAEDIKIILDAISACKTKAELDDVREAYKGCYTYTQTQIAQMKKVASVKEKEVNDNG